MEKEKIRILRLPVVMEDTGLARSTIYRKMAEKSFPRQISLGAQSVGWLERDIQTWIEGRIAQSPTGRENNKTKDGNYAH